MPTIYEFIDALGARVTIRSARTLGALLADGRITPATQFRLAGEAGFAPAGAHPAAIEVASQAGMAFGTIPVQAAVDPPPSPAPDAPTPPPRASVPHTPSPSARPAVAERPTREARPRAPLAPVRKPNLAGGVRQAGRVAAVLSIACVAGITVGVTIGGVSHSSVLAWLGAVATASSSSWLGGSRLARRTPHPTPYQAGMGSAPILLIGLLIGWPTLILISPAIASLWKALRATKPR